MATGEAAPNYYGQLTAGATDTITMDRLWEQITVVNIDGSARIDFTVDGSEPVEGGSATGRVLPAAICGDTVSLPESSTPITVTLISSGTPHYAIIGGN